MGFVSNSSSMAHIVRFPKVPESPEEIQNLLKCEAKDAESIFKEILEQHPNHIIKIITEMVDEAEWKFYDDYWQKEWKLDKNGDKIGLAKMQAERTSKILIKIHEWFNNLMEKKGDGILYYFEYDDDSSDMRWHDGDVFGDLIRWNFSHH